MVDFPAPDGEDSTSMMPRRSSVSPMPPCSDVPHVLPLFDILHLLAELVDYHFHLQPERGYGGGIRFRADRVALAVEFLREEIELAARRRHCRRSRPWRPRHGRAAGRSPREGRPWWRGSPPPGAGAADRAPSAPASKWRNCVCSRSRIASGLRDGSASTRSDQRGDGADLAQQAQWQRQRLQLARDCTSALAALFQALQDGGIAGVARLHAASLAFARLHHAAYLRGWPRLRAAASPVACRCARSPASTASSAASLTTGDGGAGVALEMEAGLDVAARQTRARWRVR